MTPEEIQQMNKTFTALTEADTQRTAEVAKLGKATAETTEKLEKIHKQFDTLEETINKRMDSEEAGKEFKKIASRMDELEALIKARVGAGGNKPNDEEAVSQARSLARKAFFGYLRHNPLTAKKSLEETLGPDQFKALIEATDTAGGYLAPPEYVAEMLKNVVQYSAIRPLARQRNTTRQEVQMPKRTTTASASWTAETGTRSETTNPAFGLESIKTHEMYAMCKVSKAELEDSEFNLEQFLNDEFSEQFGLSEGTAFVSGTGVGQPEGLLTNSSVSYTASGVAADISADGLISIYYDIKEPYLINASWVMNRSTLKVIRQMKDGEGNYLWAPGIRTDARPAAILDRPYITAPDMPAIGSNTYPILFGDFFRAYMIVDRLIMEMMQDPYTSKSTGMIEFSARRRVGGQVIIAEAIRKLKCAVS